MLNWSIFIYTINQKIEPINPQNLNLIKIYSLL